MQNLDLFLLIVFEELSSNSFIFTYSFADPKAICSIKIFVLGNLSIIFFFFFKFNIRKFLGLASNETMLSI